MLAHDVISAFMLLTRLPVARFAGSDTPPNLARAVWAFPVVGLVVNGVGGIAYEAAFHLGMPPPLAAAWTLAAMILVTGAFHEDGLADTADGFGGGTTKARKLEIMRDSRIGTYGALALALSVVIRLAAIIALVQPAIVAPALIAAGMLGRGAIILLLLTLPSVRDTGLGAAMGNLNRRSAAIGLALASVAAFVVLPTKPAVAAIVVGLFAAAGVGKYAHIQIGGFTGDTLGAAEVVAECGVLTALACVIGA